MDRRLFDAAVRGDAKALRRLTEEDASLLDQAVLVTLATPLHIAARFGHLAFAAEALRLRPELAAAEDASLETPLHEACRQGGVEMARLLLRAEPMVAYRLNRDGESSFAVAAGAGHLNVVSLLLSDTKASRFEIDAPFTCLHSASLSGHTEIVQELLKVEPDLATKLDKYGFSPLHHTCWKGHLDVTRVLLQFDSDLCSRRAVDGRTPLHLAATKGWTNILEEILSLRLDMAEVLTNQGETILHLCVKNNHFETFEYLMGKVDTTEFVNLQDCNGNNILHLAVARKNIQMVEYIIDRTRINIHAWNQQGHTALDLTQQNGSSSDIPSIRLMLLKAGSETEKGIQYVAQVYPMSLQNPSIPSRNIHNGFVQGEPTTKYPDEHFSTAAQTVMVAATLLATNAFSASISPPGGVHQDGEAVGALSTANKGFFTFFTITNDLALLTSLSIVMGLATIIPMKKSIAKHFPKIYWSVYASATFTILAYLSSRFVILPPHAGYTKWLMLPVCTFSPVVCILFFWRLWNRSKLERGYGGSETRETTQTLESSGTKESEMIEIDWRSSLEASHLVRGIDWKGSSMASNLIGDASRRDGRRDVEFLHQLSLCSQETGHVRPMNGLPIRHSY